ncbi:hypothetical protein TNCV_3776811 [Trichonephila clavipes]|nr:hypothetical protein TNCV_3776811 [Trichonephila clavipes]
MTAILSTKGSILSSQRGLCKEESSYDPRRRSLGRRGLESVPVNLLDHPIQSIALDMLQAMHLHICAEMC